MSPSSLGLLLRSVCKTSLYFVLLTKQSPPFWPLFTKKETCFLKKQVSLFNIVPEIIRNDDTIAGNPPATPLSGFIIPQLI